MFSIQQKRDISDAVQKVLRATSHPELPITGEISFLLHVDGAESWSFADIQNNGAVGDPGLNPHNELMASIPEEEARGLIEKAQATPYVASMRQSPEMPDPRATPEEFYKEMLTAELKKLHLDVHNHEVRLSKIENFIMPIMEDNLIQYHGDKIRKIEAALGATADSDANALLSIPDRMRNLETAVRQLGNQPKET
jgi:hypothetical protein